MNYRPTTTQHLWRSSLPNPSGRLALLCAAQLGMTCLTAALSAHTERDPLSLAGRIVVETIPLGSFGVLLGQVALLACWGAFSSRRWFSHIPRFVALCVWFLLAMFLGNYFAEGEIAKTLVEELTSLFLSFQLAPLLALFIAWRLITHRCFVAAHADSLSEASVYQFGIARLFWMTAEVAALLALARIVIPSHARPEELWNTLRQVQWQDAIPGAAILATIPVVLFGLSRKRGFVGYVLLTIYLLLCSLGTAWLLGEYAERWPWGSDSDTWWRQWCQQLAIEFIPAFSLYLSATFTILITLWLVRRIGYDFRRRDEEEGGSRSSNIRSSAASSSA